MYVNDTQPTTIVIFFAAFRSLDDVIAGNTVLKCELTDGDLVDPNFYIRAIADLEKATKILYDREMVVTGFNKIN